MAARPGLRTACRLRAVAALVATPASTKASCRRYPAAAARLSAPQSLPGTFRTFTDDARSKGPAVPPSSEGLEPKAGREFHILHPSMDVEKDVGLALRGIQEAYGRGDYQEALDRALGLKDWVEREFGADHPVVASALNNIALMKKLLNELDDAVMYYTMALDKYKHITGEKHRSYAATLNNLGLVFLAQAIQSQSKVQQAGLYDSAEQTFRRVLEIRTDILEEGDPALATTRSNLASVLHRTGRTTEAEELLRRSLTQVKNKLGEKHLSTATAINNLAFLLKSDKRYGEAVELYEESLAIRKQLLSETHPDVIISKNNLAELFRAMGREEDALALQQDILDSLK